MTEINSEHLDPTTEISLETVKARSVRGVVTLTGRYFILYVMTLLAQIFLGAFLTRQEFGVFGVVSAAVNFLVYFSDIGLAASLIQKKESITESDLKTTFTVQQILVFILLAVIVLLSPSVQNTYHLSQSGMYLLYALGFSLFLSSLKTIPSVILERGLRFEKIAVSNILENLVYNIVLVILAWKGFGITSFTIAVVARGVVGLGTIYYLQPWRPGLAISRASLSKLLRFGIPYQLNTFVAVIKDDGLTLLLGKIIGFDAMGILIWAQKWSQMPLRVIMDTVTKVTFPALSRMQDAKEHLARSTTRSIFFITFLSFPAIVGLVILAPVIIQIIPRYEQWAPAMIPLALVSVNAIFASFTTQITNLLNAIGRIKITFFLMVMWASLTWVLVPFLAITFGVNGAAMGFALVGASSVVAVWISKKYVNWKINDAVVRPLYATIVMGVVLLLLRGILPVNVYSVSILIIVGLTVYGVVIVGLVGASLIADARRSLRTVFSK